eukprot:830955_1
MNRNKPYTQSNINHTQYNDFQSQLLLMQKQLKQIQQTVNDKNTYSKATFAAIIIVLLIGIAYQIRTIDLGLQELIASECYKSWNNSTKTQNIPLEQSKQSRLFFPHENVECSSKFIELSHKQIDIDRANFQKAVEKLSRQLARDVKLKGMIDEEEAYIAGQIYKATEQLLEGTNEMAFKWSKDRSSMNAKIKIEVSQSEID